jgi:regulatory protein SWI6
MRLFLVSTPSSSISNLTDIAISSLVTDVEKEFSKELDSKQARIDNLHSQLREASALLGEQRRRREQLETEAKEQASRKHRLANLTRALDTERARLHQIQQQLGQSPLQTEMQLGDADKGLTLPTLPSNVLANISSNPQMSVSNLDQAQRQLLSSLPPAHVLRARINAYQGNNQVLEQNVRDLQSKSSELVNKYRKVVGLCTGTPIDKVDQVGPKLLRAIESEPNVDLRRIRDFLGRVEVPT